MKNRILYSACHGACGGSVCLLPSKWPKSLQHLLRLHFLQFLPIISR